MTAPYSDTSQATPDSASSRPIGTALRQAREARGLSQGDAAQALKLTLRQVEALESEQFERLPGAAFARGFLRNYARLVQLDPDPLIADFDAQYAGPGVELRQVSNAQGALPVGGGGRGPSAMPAALVAAFLLAVVIAGWYFDWFRQPEPTEQAAGTGPVIVLPPASSIASPASGSVAPPAEGAVPPAVPQAASEGAAVAPPPPAAAPTESVAQGGAPLPAASPVAAPDGLDRLAFSFAQEAWVEVRDGSGAIIFSRISGAGSAQEVQGKGPFALVVGNAPNVRLTLNGQPVDLAPHTKVSVARLTLP